MKSLRPARDLWPLFQRGGLPLESSGPFLSLFKCSHPEMMLSVRPVSHRCRLLIFIYSCRSVPAAGSARHLLQSCCCCCVCCVVCVGGRTCESLQRSQSLLNFCEILDRLIFLWNMRERERVWAPSVYFSYFTHFTFLNFFADKNIWRRIKIFNWRRKRPKYQ